MVGKGRELVAHRLHLQRAVHQLTDPRAVGDGGAQVVGVALLVHLRDQLGQLGAIDHDLSLGDCDLIVGGGQRRVGQVELLLLVGQLSDLLAEAAGARVTGGEERGDQSGYSEETHLGYCARPPRCSSSRHKEGREQDCLGWEH